MATNPSPSRCGDLSDAQREAIRQGHAVSLPSDIVSVLKVFDEPDNQLGLEDIMKVSIACLECAQEGMYQRAELEIPRFGKAEIQSYSCSQCSYAYRKVRALEVDRSGLNVDALESGLGRRITLTVKTVEDLNREVLWSDGSVLIVPELDIESSSREGVISTVEGCLRGIVQKLRFTRFGDCDDATVDDTSAPVNFAALVEERVNSVVSALKESGKSFTFIIEDELDTSHVEVFGENDTQVAFTTYLIDDLDVVPPVVCSFNGVEIGAQVQAMYMGAWVPNCRIVGLLGVMISVENLDDLDAGKWQVSIDEIRGCDNPSCHCCRSGSQTVPSCNSTSCESDADLLSYLNRFADHITAQEGHLSSQQVKQEMNRGALFFKELEGLDALD